jgi:hypothetical protein
MLERPEGAPPLVDSALSQVLAEPVVAGLLKLPGVPASWNFYLISLGAMLALAGLDVLGAMLAKEWVERHHAGFFLAGLLAFGLLFAVYAASLRVAELTIVTMGWIIFLQIAIILLDTLRYGLQLPPGKWLAIGALLILQGYLVLAPNGEPTGA